jgi:C4-dicarboxylate transporter, DctQ subunit
MAIAPARLIERIAAAIERLGRIGDHVSNLGMWLLAAAVMYDVLLRALGEPTLWAAEVSVYLMLAVAFLGAGGTQTVGGHFRVTFVRDLCGPRTRAMLDGLALLIALVLTALFTIGAWRLASFSWMLDFRTPTILQFPLWALQGLMVVGGALLTLATLRDLLLVIVHGSAVQDARSGSSEVI